MSSSTGPAPQGQNKLEAQLGKVRLAIEGKFAITVVGAIALCVLANVDPLTLASALFDIARKGFSI